MHKKLKYFFKLIILLATVFTVASLQNDEKIQIIDKSNIEITEEKDFNYLIFNLKEEGKTLEQVSFNDGIFYYMVSKSDEMVQFPTSFDLLSYNTHTNEKIYLYSYTGGLFFDFAAFDSILFWIIDKEDCWQIISFELSTKTTKVLYELNKSDGIVGTPVLTSSSEFLIWDVFKSDRTVESFLYNTKNSEIKKLNLNNRYIKSLYYGLQICNDIIIYPIKENDLYYMAGNNINDNKEILKIEIPSEVAGFSAFENKILWNNSFSALDEQKVYFYDIEKKEIYILNNENERFFLPRVAKNHIVWSNDNAHSLYLLNTDNWKKYIISKEESNNGIIYTSQKGEIYTVSYYEGICGVINFN